MAGINNRIVKSSQLEINSAGCLVEPRLTGADVFNFRERIGLTQEEFAKKFKLSLWTLRSWEQNPTRSLITQARLQFFNELFKNKKVA